MKVAIVTGANKGIGKAIARGLADDGFVVYLGSRNTQRGADVAAELAAELSRGLSPIAGSGKIIAIQLDVTDEASVRHAVEQIEADYGHLDVLVNNAGISAGPDVKGIRPPAEETAANMRAVFDTNVFAVVTVTNLFLPLLRRAPAARIVNITSKRGSLGEEGAWVGQPYMPYSSSKTALNAITVHYARSLSHTAIKVNGAAPGHVATDFNNFRGTRTPEQGAAVAVRLAQLGADGPSGLVFEDDVQLAWWRRSNLPAW
ncbi:SDR family NAD(P)-dependent oxidoreductase [Undibacterium sp. TJN25]|uniref:SDR family NAD(P)-dependent oxidoreductase n=1 Tax=Undibacterium sp. TJN25 TaxID=3413056 RepID=UPI003BF1C469